MLLLEGIACAPSLLFPVEASLYYQKRPAQSLLGLWRSEITLLLWFTLAMSTSVPPMLGSCQTAPLQIRCISNQ